MALRQHLDLYVCQRPVRWLQGVPSPVRSPEKTDMVIFRENTEDIYAGVEWEAGSAEADRVIGFLRDEMDVREDPLSQRTAASASSPSRWPARSVWCARPCSTRSPRTAPR